MLVARRWRCRAGTLSRTLTRALTRALTGHLTANLAANLTRWKLCGVHIDVSSPGRECSNKRIEITSRDILLLYSDNSTGIDRTAYRSVILWTCRLSRWGIH